MSKGQPSALREAAEFQFAAELAALAKADTREKPPRWLLSPWAVVTYLMGGKLEGAQEQIAGPDVADGVGELLHVFECSAPACRFDRQPSLVLEVLLGEPVGPVA